MRRHELHKWREIGKNKGLLFFALLVDELLFDYTLDTFKLPALNSKTICYELMNAISEA